MLLLEKKRQQRKEKRERQKREGKPMTAKEKLAAEQRKKFLEQLGKEGVLEISQEEEPRKPLAQSFRKKKTVKKEEVQEDNNEEETVSVPSAHEGECMLPQFQYGHRITRIK